MKFLNELLGLAVITGPLPMFAKLDQSIYQGACMKRTVPCAILMVFLVSNLLGSGEVYADDPSEKIAEMQRTINAQAAEITQLKRERDRLKHNVDQAWANVQRIDKEEAELKKIVATLEKEIAKCRGTNR